MIPVIGHSHKPLWTLGGCRIKTVFFVLLKDLYILSLHFVKVRLLMLAGIRCALIVIMVSPIYSLQYSSTVVYSTVQSQV